MFDAGLLLGVRQIVQPADWRAAPVRPFADGVRAGNPPCRRPAEQGKARIREQAAGLVGAMRCWKSELKSHHSPGTCTFMAANSNQMLMEAMGLHVPGTFHPARRRASRRTHREAARAVSASQR
jgi:phosphogluconate dehydratase